MNDYVVIGGGINGLLVSRELSTAGAKVILLEKGRCGTEASWAGGGIVSPLYPWRYAPPITALASWAQNFYPQLARELMEETGIDPELDQSGLLMLAAEDSEAALRWALENNKAMQLIDAASIYDRESRLGTGFDSGLWMPDVASIRNPKLLRALVLSLSSRQNVSIMENCHVKGFTVKGEKVHRISILKDGRQSELEAKVVVICAGAWSEQILGELRAPVGIHPVKGQMLLYKLPERAVRSVLLTAGKYVISRKDGHMLVGSTLEYKGFDKSISEEAKSDLQQAAHKLLPLLRNYRPIAQWAGLRPGSSDGVPYIGKISNLDNVFLNAGHFRNGLVLAPASARLLVDILLNRAPILDRSPYDPANRQSSL